MLVAVPGDVTDADAPPGARRRRDRARAARALVNSAGGLGPSPLPPLADYPLDALPSLFEVNVARPSPLVQEALPALRAGERHRRRTSPPTPASRPTPAGAATAPRRPRSSSSPGCWPPRSPRSPSYVVDPGDLRTQMHQDAFPGEDISDRPLPEDGVPGMLRHRRAAPAVRPLPGRAAGERMSATALGLAPPALDFELVPDLEAHEPPEATGSRPRRRPAAGLARRRRAGPRPLPGPPRLPRPGDLLVVNRSATVAAALDAWRPAHDGPRRRSPSTSPRRCPTAPGWSSPANRPRTARARRCSAPATGWSPVRSSRSPAAAASRCSNRSRDPTRLVVATLDLPPDVGTFLARHGHPIRYRHVPQPWPLSAYQTVFADRAGQRRDAQCRPAVHRRARHPAGHGRRRRRADRAPHRACRHWRATRLPYPERYRVPARHRRRRERHAAGRPSGGRRRHHRGAGARDGGRTPTAWSPRAAAGPTSSSAPSDRLGRSAAW